MKKLKKINPHLFKIIYLFYNKNLNYNLFKCEHIFEGINSNLDIIFLTKKDYQQAGKILEESGYRLYLPESVEKYKRMYVKVQDDKLFAVHLHREIAWHNIKIMGKSSLFKRQVHLNEYLVVPSAEDSLLIHTAHILYENFKIRKREIDLLTPILKKNIDWNYINKQAKIIGCQKEMHYVFKLIKNDRQISKKYCQKTLILKILRHPSCWLSFSGKLLKSIFRKISPKRKGCLISFIGVQGAGKTTMTRSLYDKYSEISSFFHGQFGYYFGWEPFSFYAKSLAKLMKKKNKKIFAENQDEEHQENKNQPRFNIFKELLFIYNYLEYLQRYWFVIYPQLRKGKLVITDRYFYDLYGMYSYAPKSIILKLLFRLYPRPDYTFLLAAKAETIAKRGKNPEVFSDVKKNDYRGYVNPQKIDDEQKRFYNLISVLPFKIIDTEDRIAVNVSKIINLSWRGLLK